jgi:hypothetical protein
VQVVQRGHRSILLAIELEDGRLTGVTSGDHAASTPALMRLHLATIESASCP